MSGYYQISIIPSYKPWRGFYNIYTDNEKLFEALSEKFLPDMSLDDVPEELRHLAIDPEINDDGDYVPYVPNGTEDWENMTAIVNGEEVCLEYSLHNLLDNISDSVEFPITILGTAQAYTE